MGENEPKKKNFFETAAGIITGITALLVAITGLIATLNSSGCFKPTSNSEASKKNQTEIDSNKLNTVKDINQNDTSNRGQFKGGLTSKDNAGVSKKPKVTAKTETQKISRENNNLVKPLQKSIVQWSENEEIQKHRKSNSRYINIATKKSPITIKIRGNIIYPLHRQTSDPSLNPVPENKIVLKVYINDETNDAWDINSQNFYGDNFYDIVKNITIEKPDDKQIKIEIIFFSEEKSFTSGLFSYSSPVIQKGFKIEILN